MIAFHSFIVTLMLSLVFIIPVSLVWKLPWRIGVSGALFIGLISGSISWLFSRLIGPFPMIIHLLLGTVTIVLCAAACIGLRFFRDPERKPTEVEGILLSPADGCVRYIKRFSHGEIPVAQKNNHCYTLKEFTMTDILAEGGVSIGIEMNILDIHVNRSPIPGTVQLLEAIPGRFISLKRLDAIFKNERFTTVIENENIRIGVVQIASRLVRRIVSYVSVGDLLHAGQRIGMIRFGSQVDLIVPDIPGLEIKVETGQRVQAGITALAEYNQDGHRDHKSLNRQ